MAIGVEDKSRLHCCGVHHHASDRPQGVTLLLSDDHTPPSFQVACYGTGDNPDSVILLYPSITHLPFHDPQTQILADELARGANVTVLVPHFVQDGHEQLQEEAPAGGGAAAAAAGDDSANGVLKSDTFENRAALEHFLKDGMKVQFIGVLNVSRDAERAGVDCRVSIESRQESLGFEPVPTLYLMQSARRETRVVQEDSVLVKECLIQHNPLDLLRTRGHQGNGHTHDVDGQSEAYIDMMKELLYFFKKHLHDWS